MPLRLCLAAMPWLAVDTPSLQVGILRRRVDDTVPSIEVREYHGGIRWAEHLLAASNCELTPRHYLQIGDGGLAHGLGDWVFAGSLYDDPQWRMAELRGHARAWRIDLDLAMRMRALAGDFVAAACTEILAGEPDIVGFTTTFMQTVPSLAVARELKRRRPGLLVVLGGANCEGPMGHALHRNHAFVDFVVRGEGEAAFPALLRHIEAGTAPADVPGVCWWSGDRSVANAETTGSVAPDLIPMPDYDEWFAVLRSSPVREYVSPFLFVEGSRGCWWGEKHQCTFCGLNSALINFRAKPADRFWRELSYLVRRHRVLDVMTADNIIDMAYYRDLLPRLADAGWDLRIQYEAKANVTADQIAALAAARVCAVQYGIENLNSRVLKIMDKGVTAGTNVRVLRDSEDNHLTVRWNYLYGFPGETPADYQSAVEQMPALVHLQPPSGHSRIALERFSPYFERPELGFARRRPAEFYRYVYDLPEGELADLAYFFECDDHGIAGESERALVEAVGRWDRDHPSSSLFRVPGSGSLTIRDRRRGWPARDHVLSGWRHAAYDALERPRSARSVQRYLAEHGHEVPDAEVRIWLAGCLRDGLVFADEDSYVALATRDVPVRLAVAADSTERGRVGTAVVRPRVADVPAPVVLDTSAPEATVRFIAWLRDRHSDTVDVTWRAAAIDRRLDVTQLYHLPAPLPLRPGEESEVESDAARRWESAHRSAMCYYRAGPGFLLVTDMRQAQSAARYVLDDPTLVATFERCLRPVRLGELDPAQTEAVEALRAERLLLHVDGWLTTLPSRMRRWPVPSHLA